MTVDFAKLHQLDNAELQQEAHQLGIDVDGLRRPDLAFAIGQKLGERDQVSYGRGVLEIHAEGFGFLRSAQDNFLPGPDDIYVSQSQIRRFKLRTGDTVIGLVRAPKEGERYLALLRVENVNGDAPSSLAPPSFETLTAIYPDDRIPLDGDAVLRALDVVAPIGLGQRGILVAPSRTGRVEMLRRLAGQLTADEDLLVTVLLVGERPEEIHEWREATTAEVVATPFDEPPARHVQVANIVFERARRMVERGDDAVLLVDSLTRLLRFCLADLPPSGRDLGGVDTVALHRIRRYLGAARALEEGGSLTVVGVVNGDRENSIDRVLLDDLRDVVNWEVTLSRELADVGIHPPIDVQRSGTRRADRLVGDASELERRATWRAGLTGDPLGDASSLLEYCAPSAAPSSEADTETNGEAA